MTAARPRPTFGIVGIPWSMPAPVRAPARFGDVVELTSQVSEFRRSSFDVAHQSGARRASRGGQETTRVGRRDAVDPARQGAAVPKRGLQMSSGFERMRLI